uniref:ATP synthase protein 8 n=1 Tax=Candida prachuapensis TaxID=536035 RepID=U3MHA1_9ASCO|nr:ATP synthase F0 subunit 8 [Candida prachuapensis]AGW07381.1 ATP synthase F0 subunit 8 [Candida prachuapensis]
MPQTVPFYWMNLLTGGMAMFTLLVYMVSTIMLPNMLRLLVARAMMMRV